jgi:hypothetical protein
MGLSPLGNLLNGAVNRAGIGRQVTAAFIIDRSNKVLNEILPEYRCQDAQTQSFSNGTVTIYVKSGAVQDYLIQYQDQFLSELNQSLGGCHIQTVRFRIKPKQV